MLPIRLVVDACPFLGLSLRQSFLGSRSRCIVRCDATNETLMTDGRIQSECLSGE